MKCQVLLFKDSGAVLSKLIRWQTDSIYCHAAFLFTWDMGAQQVITESVVWHGVRDRGVSLPEGADVFDIEGLTDEDAYRIWCWTREQIGKPYDYRGILRFLSRRPASENGRFFCSEYVFQGCQKGGKWLLNTAPWKVNPGDLAESTLLRFVKEL